MITEILDFHLDYAALGLDNGGYCPKLYTYIQDNSPEMHPNRLRPAVIICPGGGYEMTSDREAEPVALQFAASGFQVFTLRYSVKPAVFPAALAELAAAVAMVRDNAEQWYVDADKIVIAGFSAGGHLAASLGVFWNETFLTDLLQTEKERIKPNGLILSYPVITSGAFAHRGSFISLLGSRYDELLEFVSLENRVTASTPPTFLWHTWEDDCVPCENSLLLAQALKRSGVSLELHIYPRGGHGLSLANEETSCSNGYGIQAECQNWVSMAARWVKAL